MKYKSNVPSDPNGGHGTPMRSKKRRNDGILIVSLLLLLAIVSTCVLLFREEGDMVVVRVGTDEYGRYALSKDREVEIRTGANGEELNRLVIREGKAEVTEATCPDGICAAHQPISYDGEAIACKPHCVVITVEKGKR